MKKISIISLILLLANACTGLTTGSGTGTDSCTVAVLNFDSLTFHSHESLLPNGGSPCCDIDMNIIRAVGDDSLTAKVNAALVQFLFNKTDVSIETAFKVYTDSLQEVSRADMKEFYRPDDEDLFQFDYDYQLTSELAENTRPDIMGYCRKYYEYTGGAHGSYFVCYANVDLRSGKILTVDDVFVEEKQSDILQLLMKQLMADNECESINELRENTGLTMLGDLFLSDHNFLLTTGGIDFIYNQYEIAAYACGITTIHLTYEQLAGMVKIGK